MKCLQKVRDHFAIFVLFAEVDEAFLASAVNVAHHLDLTVSFVDVCLIDAYCINPDIDIVTIDHNLRKALYRFFIIGNILSSISI